MYIYLLFPSIFRHQSHYAWIIHIRTEEYFTNTINQWFFFLNLFSDHIHFLSPQLTFVFLLGLFTTYHNPLKIMNNSDKINSLRTLWPKKLHVACNPPLTSRERIKTPSPAFNPLLTHVLTRKQQSSKAAKKNNDNIIHPFFLLLTLYFFVPCFLLNPVNSSTNNTILCFTHKRKRFLLFFVYVWITKSQKKKTFIEIKNSL